MTKHVIRWILLLGWTAAMAFVWALFVPKGLSVGSFILLGLSGPLVLVCTSVLWWGQRPSRSVTQILAEMEAVPTYRRMSK